jgi:hypothetical protein
MISLKIFENGFSPSRIRKPALSIYFAGSRLIFAPRGRKSAPDEALLGAPG